jgi:hypothetical protein
VNLLDPLHALNVVYDKSKKDERKEVMVVWSFNEDKVSDFAAMEPLNYLCKCATHSSTSALRRHRRFQLFSSAFVSFILYSNLGSHSAK